MLPDTFDRVAVLSAHLDDGVLSLAGWMHRMTRRGASVVLATMLAGDPDDDAPASSWDRRSGFRTAGDAARARRAEDRRACAILGVSPEWLPFGDVLHGRGATDDVIWAAIEPLVAGVDAVLAPGFPLNHPDHEWLAGLVARRRGSLRAVGLYAEQPYRHHGGGEVGTPESIADTTGALRWNDAQLDTSDRWAKLRAVRAYRSQLRLLSGERFVAWRLARGRRSFGEALAWLS